MVNVYTYKRNTFGTILSVMLKVDSDAIKDESVILTFPLKYKLSIKYTGLVDGIDKTISYSKIKTIKNQEYFYVLLVKLKCMIDDMRKVSKVPTCHRILVTVNEEDRTYKQYYNLYYSDKLFSLDNVFMLNVEEVITILNGLVASIYSVNPRLAL